MHGILIDQKIFSLLLFNYLPEVLEKFKACNLDCSVFSIQWFVCLYCKTLNCNREILDIVFDNLLIQGNVALFKIGIALLKWLKVPILKCSDFPQLLSTLEEGLFGLNDGLRFQEMINGVYFNRTILKLARDCFPIDEKPLIGKGYVSEGLLGSLKKKLKESQGLCNEENSYCLTQMEIAITKEKHRFSSHFYIFKQDYRLLQINDDYIKQFSKISQVKKPSNSNRDVGLSLFKGDLVRLKDSLLIIRHVHICKNEHLKEEKPKEINCIKLEKRLSGKEVDNNKTPSTLTPLDSGNKTNKRLKDEEKENIKDSVMFFKKGGVFLNLDEEVFQKYLPQIKQSQSFCFNNELLGLK